MLTLRFWHAQEQRSVYYLSGSESRENIGADSIILLKHKQMNPKCQAKSKSGNTLFMQPDGWDIRGSETRLTNDVKTRINQTCIYESLCARVHTQDANYWSEWNICPYKQLLCVCAWVIQCTCRQLELPKTWRCMVHDSQCLFLLFHGKYLILSVFCERCVCRPVHVYQVQWTWTWHYSGINCLVTCF